MPSRSAIEPVRRSFLLVEALSRRRTSNVGVLVGETGLPRPTVIRLLHTLIELGYVARVSRQHGYRLTDRVLGLASSIRFVDHLVDAAMPHMSRFTADHGWPLYLATLSYGAIMIRHSTAADSPLSFESAGLNLRRPMLTSALGRVWLAFCSEEERNAVLRDIGGLTSRQEATLRQSLAAIRREGYAFTRPPRPARLNGIAVAIREASRDGERVIGSLSMRFPSSAMTEAEVGSRYGRSLQLLARMIAHDTRKKAAV